MPGVAPSVDAHVRWVGRCLGFFGDVLFYGNRSSTSSLIFLNQCTILRSPVFKKLLSLLLYYNIYI